jgi:NADH:ubiquinone oxidoreductase subunit H
MSEWFLVIAIVLVALIGALVLAEWLARRYTLEIRRRIEPYAGDAARDAGDPFDDDGHAAG